VQPGAVMVRVDLEQQICRPPLARTVKTIYTATCRLKRRRSFARGRLPRP